MNLIDQIALLETWTVFYGHLAEGNNSSQRELRDLEDYIANQEYLAVVNSIRLAEPMPYPQKKIISKLGSDKKRTVYVYPRNENYVLKVLAHLLLKKYDSLFAPNLYSFRANWGVRRAIDWLKRDRGLSHRYIYKTDIHDYFNSADVSILLSKLEIIMADDKATYQWIAQLLLNPYVILPDKSVVKEQKGMMAGVPIAAFLANVYLMDLDWLMYQQKIRYARYSDDLIVFGETEQQRTEAVEIITRYLETKHLTMNPTKVLLANPYESWNFLGVSYCKGIFDIAPISATKLKKKMWRKSRSLLRWKDRKGKDNTCAVKVFINKFNKKFFEREDNELTWTHWYFPLINTATTLAQIDHYYQECIRYIATQKHNKGRYNFRYEDMKQLGYRSLVHEYYQLKIQQETNT